MNLLRNIAVLLVCAAAFGQQPTPDTAVQQRENVPTFRSDVKLVNVYVTVVDEKGAPVGGLTKDDFQLSEDGVPQSIAVFGKESQLPLSIVLALDTSLSTRKDLRLELDSAQQFIKSILRRQDVLSVYQFAEEVDELVPFTSDIGRIESGLRRAHIGSATAMYDAIFLASRSLERREGRKVLVVITDGGDTISKVDYAEALRAAQIADTLVYSIIDVPIEASAGRNTGGEHALIQISADTGGKSYYSDSPQQLDHAFQQVSDELRTQYLLAYYPKQRLAESDFRRIEVKLRPGLSGLHARNRAGYFTSKIE